MKKKLERSVPAHERLPDILFVEDVAVALRSSVESVRNMVSRGQLMMAKRGRYLCIPKEDFIEWLREDMRARRARQRTGGLRRR